MVVIDIDGYKQYYEIIIEIKKVQVYLNRTIQSISSKRNVEEYVL